MTASQAKRKAKARPKEKRIYVVVAKTVTVGGGLVVQMEPGRMAAQACHVTGMYRAQAGMPYKETTTIVLEARNSKEMLKIIKELAGNVEFFTFHDENREFYFQPGRVLTAICTVPVYPSKIEDILGHLELM